MEEDVYKCVWGCENGGWIVKKKRKKREREKKYSFISIFLFHALCDVTLVLNVMFFIVQEYWMKYNEIYLIHSFYAYHNINFNFFFSLSLYSERHFIYLRWGNIMCFLPEFLLLVFFSSSTFIINILVCLSLTSSFSRYLSFIFSLSRCGETIFLDGWDGCVCFNENIATLNILKLFHHLYKHSKSTINVNI